MTGTYNAITPSFFSIEIGSYKLFFYSCFWPGLAWNHSPPDLSLLCSLRWQAHTSASSYWLR
jgi:hypothetical protein